MPTYYLRGGDCSDTPVVTSSGTASGTEGSAFTYTIVATNSPTSYGLTGTLPAGLSFNSSPGVISGTPTCAASGTYNVTVSATNASCCPGTKALTITIANLPAPTLDDNSVSGESCTYFEVQMTGTNLSGGSWGLSGMSLPLWVFINSSGKVFGTPTEAYSGSITVVYTNPCGQATATLDIEVTEGCLAVTVTCRSRSASKTKCGFVEYGTPSSPPKRYLTRTLAGGITEYTPCESGCQEVVFSYTGARTYSRPACSFSDTGNLHKDFYDGCVTLGLQTDSAVSTLSPFTDTAFCVGSGVTVTNTSTTVRTVAGDGSCCTSAASDFGGATATETLSNEYTTAQLADDVDEALAAASFGSYGGCSDAVFTMSEDELTISKREVDTKLSFSAVGSGCRVVWEIWNRTTDTMVSNGCAVLMSGDTEYVVNIPPPATPGDAYYVANPQVFCGSPC